jgi:hypothetical protein
MGIYTVYQVPASHSLIAWKVEGGYGSVIQLFVFFSIATLSLILTLFYEATAWGWLHNYQMQSWEETNGIFKPNNYITMIQ